MIFAHGQKGKKKMGKKYYDGMMIHDVLSAHLDDKRYVELLKAFAEVKGLDAVEVIRCKDCKWLGVANMKDKYGQPNPVPCCRGNGNIRIGIKPDDYCSRGERKEDD